MDILPQNTPNDNPLKVCTKCGKSLPAISTFFQRNKAARDGFRPDCKDCRKDYLNQPEVRDRKTAYNTAYYADEENRQRVLDHRKDKYHNDEERRAKALEYNKNPDVREYQRLYLKEYNKRPDIKERDREARRIAKKNRRAHSKSIQGSYTHEQILDLLKRQKSKCYYCQNKFEIRDGKSLYHIDHTFPINRVVGTDIPANDIAYLVLACPSCNHKKSDKFPWEFPEGNRLL